MTQRESIAAYLDKHGSITPMEAFSELGITKLSTRIGEMIALGADIQKETVSGKNRYGKKIHFCKYSFAKE